MMYVFISRRVRIFSANSEKVWNTWAVSKSCEEFAPKLKFLLSKNKLTEVWAISESCEVVQTAHVSSPTCASHLLHGLLCGLNLCPFGFVRVQVTSICSFIWVLDVALWLFVKSPAARTICLRLVFACAVWLPGVLDLILWSDCVFQVAIALAAALSGWQVRKSDFMLPIISVRLHGATT